MAKSEQGIHGPVKGKVGNVVYTTWKGIPVVKKAPLRTAPPTEKESINRFNFQLSNSWLSPLTPFLRIGFKNYTPTNQGFTAAKTYLSKHAFIKDGYNSSIDPSLMKVSYGDLAPAEDTQMELNEEKQLVFAWNTSITVDQSPLDQVMLLAYNVEKKDPKMILGGKFRQDGTASLSLANAKPGEYHVYIAFVAEDRSRQSNSEYMGSVSITE